LFAWDGVVGLFVSFGLIYVSQVLIIICVTRFLYYSGFIGDLFIVLRDITHEVCFQLLACKKPPSDRIEAQ
jgi:hypothetical protein